MRELFQDPPAQSVTTIAAIDRVLDALERHDCVPRRSGAGWMAPCPAHDDRNPSLALTIGDDGRVLLHCHAGCRTGDVLAAVELQARDLFDGPVSSSPYDYVDEQGALLFQVVRYEPKTFRQRRPDGNGGWIWNLNGARRVLYRLPQVIATARAAGLVIVVEGEGDVHAVEAAGQVATCNPGGAGKWREEYSEALAGAHVLVVADRDEPGYAHARSVRDSLARAAASVTVAQAAEGNDVSDHLAAGRHLAELVPISLDQPPAAVDVEALFPVLDWHALWTDDTEDEWIIEPLVPARRLVAIYSTAKLGKSLLMLEVAVAGATGRPVLGVTLDRPRIVLYVDFENDPKADVRERLKAMGYGPDDLANLRYLSFPSLAMLDSPQGGEELMANVAHHHAELVVIDTVSRAVGGSENDNDTWLAFYRHTGLRLKKAGVTLVRLDHAGKDESKGQRGGSAKLADVDMVWRLSKVTESMFRLDCEANRMPIAERTLVLHRETNPLRHRVDAQGQRGAWFEKVRTVNVALDAAGLPPDVGRPTARTALKEAEIKASDDVLNEALRLRKLSVMPVRNESAQVVDP